MAHDATKDDLRFARAVYKAAAVWGLLIIPHMFVTLPIFERVFPPPMNHPEFYYGFVGVAAGWQLGYYIISTDPLRFRPMMIAAIMAKGLFFVSTLALWLQGRTASGVFLSAIADSIFCAFFIAAYFRIHSR